MIDRRNGMPAFVAMACLLPLAGCGREPTRFDEVQQETRRGAPAVSKQALAGSTFNRFFPKADGDFDVVFSQEKPGFAQAKLVRKGEDVATLSVFDTASNPEALDKFKATEERFGDYPMAEVGSRGSAILVGDRFQVQIRSQDDNFSRFDREDWLKKFDLAGLARLQ